VVPGTKRLVTKR